MLSIQDFAAAANQVFDLQIGTTSMPLTLVTIRPLAFPSAPGLMRAPFSLLFRSTSPIALPQKIYPLRHAAMGLLQLFLVPVAREREGIVYEAVFN